MKTVNKQSCRKCCGTGYVPSKRTKRRRVPCPSCGGNKKGYATK